MGLISSALIFGAGFVVCNKIKSSDLTPAKEKIVSGIGKLLLGQDFRIAYKPKYILNYSQYRKGTSRVYDRMQREARHRIFMEDYEYTSKEDAQKVLDRMQDLIESYKFASVSDLEDCIQDIVGTAIVRGTYSYDWGWNNLSNVEIKQMDGENRYYICFPPSRHTEEISDDEYEDEDIANEEDPDEEG